MQLNLVGTVIPWEIEFSLFTTTDAAWPLITDGMDNSQVKLLLLLLSQSSGINVSANETFLLVCVIASSQGPFVTANCKSSYQKVFLKLIFHQMLHHSSAVA